MLDFARSLYISEFMRAGRPRPEGNTTHSYEVGNCLRANTKKPLQRNRTTENANVA